jgi:hypothetical protein
MKTFPSLASFVNFSENDDCFFSMLLDSDAIIFEAHKTRLESKATTLRKLAFGNKGNRYDILTAHLNRQEINKMCKTVLENLKTKPNVKKVKYIKEIPDWVFVDVVNECSLLFSYNDSTDSLAVLFIPSRNMDEVLSAYKPANLIKRIWNVVRHKSLDGKAIALGVSEIGQDLANYFYQLQRDKK